MLLRVGKMAGHNAMGGLNLGNSRWSGGSGPCRSPLALHAKVLDIKDLRRRTRDRMVYRWMVWRGHNGE